MRAHASANPGRKRDAGRTSGVTRPIPVTTTLLFSGAGRSPNPALCATTEVKERVMRRGRPPGITASHRVKSEWLSRALQQLERVRRDRQTMSNANRAASTCRCPKLARQSVARLASHSSHLLLQAEHGKLHTVSLRGDLRVRLQGLLRKGSHHAGARHLAPLSWYHLHKQCLVPSPQAVCRPPCHHFLRHNASPHLDQRLVPVTVPPFAQVPLHGLPQPLTPWRALPPPQLRELLVADEVSSIVKQTIANELHGRLRERGGVDRVDARAHARAI